MKININSLYGYPDHHKECIYDCDGLPKTIQYEIQRYVINRTSSCSIKTLIKEQYAYKSIYELLKTLRIRSILSFSEDALIRKMRSHLVSNGLNISKTRKRGTRITIIESEQITYLRHIYRYTAEQKQLQNNKNGFRNDKLDIRNLGYHVSTNPINPVFQLDFTKIKDKAIRHEAKMIFEQQSHNMASRSLYNELLYVTEFLNRAYAHGLRSIAECKRSYIDSYREWLVQNKNNPTVLAAMSYLKSFLFDASILFGVPFIAEIIYDNEIKTRNPGIPRPYSDTEINRFDQMMEECQDEQLKRLIQIHQNLGTRISDTLLLLQKNINYEENGIIILQQKNRRSYWHPLDNGLMDLLRESADYSISKYNEKDYVFVSAKNHPYTYSMVNDRIRKLISEYGLVDDIGLPFIFSSHRFRHTYATRMAYLGLPDDDIAKLLGHSNTRTVARYRKLMNWGMHRDIKSLTDYNNQLMNKYGGGYNE